MIIMRQLLLDAVTAVLIDHLLYEFMQTLSLQLPLYQIKLRPDLHQLVYYFQNVSLIVYVLANVFFYNVIVPHEIQCTKRVRVAFQLGILHQ